MKVLLTGANGHLGANTIRELLKRGHDVVAFVRPTADRRGLAGLKISYAEGDVTDSNALIRAAEGCDVIIHSAIFFAFGPKIRRSLNDRHWKVPRTQWPQPRPSVPND